MSFLPKSFLLLSILLLGIYIGGILTMWNYAMPEIYKRENPYVKYEEWKKNGSRERLVISVMWPIIVFEKEIPYDYGEEY